MKLRLPEKSKYRKVIKLFHLCVLFIRNDEVYPIRDYPFKQEQYNDFEKLVVGDTPYTWSNAEIVDDDGRVIADCIAVVED